MLAGKTMGKIGNFLESFLFNLPFSSVPIEGIKGQRLKHRIRIAKSGITAALTVARKTKHQRNTEEDQFVLCISESREFQFFSPCSN
jgi:hypothetical protein